MGAEAHVGGEPAALGASRRVGGGTFQQQRPPWRETLIYLTTSSMIQGLVFSHTDPEMYPE